MPGRRKKSPGNIERRGDSLRLRLCVGGKRHTFTFQRPADVSVAEHREAVEQFARDEAQRLERQTKRQRAGLPGPMQFSALLEKFETEALPALAPGTQRSYNDSIKPFRAYFVEKAGNPTVDTIRAAHIHDYMTWRRVNRLDGKAPLHPRTVQKDRVMLHRLFAFADMLEIREGNPVRRVKAEKPDEREYVILDRDQCFCTMQECGLDHAQPQYEALVTACAEQSNPMLSMYVLVLAETGMRCESEALWLRWEDIDLTGGFVRVVSGRNGHRTKSGKGRDVPMTPRLADAMREHFAEYRFNGSEWLFHHLTTRRTYKAGERIGSLRHLFQKACEAAGLPAGFRQHDLRHRRVTTWLAEGRDPVLVMKALGHSDLRITMEYFRFVREHLRPLVELRGRDLPARTQQG